MDSSGWLWNKARALGEREGRVRGCSQTLSTSSSAESRTPIPRFPLSQEETLHPTSPYTHTGLGFPVIPGC